MRSLVGCLLLVMLAPFASAADLTGKWSGSLEAKTPSGEAVVVPANVELKQQGDEVTGRVWKDTEHQFSIEKGTISGDQITFEFRAPEGSEEADPIVHAVRLSVVSQSRLQGQIEFAIEGEKMTGKLTLTREK